MPEDAKRAEVQWTHLDVLMKAGGQITLGRMAPLDGVAAAVDNHNLYAVYDAERTAEIFCLICNRMKDSYRDAQERARALGWHNAGALGAAG
jgi:hypothetical protein